MKVMAIDLGDARTGIAISDAMGWLTGFTTVIHSWNKDKTAQEIAALKRENESLKERVEYWKGQTRRSQGVTTDRKAVRKAADALVKDYGAEISGSDIAGDLQSLYNFNPRICQW